MMTAEADDRAYKALGHRERRRLLRLVARDESSVGALADATGIAQPIVSQHLRVLRQAELVQVRVDGNRRLYSVDFGRLHELRAFLDEFWNDRLRQLKSVAEETP